ncbi:MAG: Ribulose-phosphate 3-epimerase [Holosporales bacterium]
MMYNGDIGDLVFFFMVCVVPSILSCNLLNLQADLAAFQAIGVQKIHFDVMDGHFVPNLTFGPALLKQIRAEFPFWLDVHLMVENPAFFIDLYGEAGADSISVHIENTPHIFKLIEQIKKYKAKAGVVINPGTPIHALDAVLPIVDYVLIMSVNPGFAGQRFIENVLDKVDDLAKKRDVESYDFSIMIDGGINRKTAPNAVRAGCDQLVIGSAFFEEPFASAYAFYENL